MGQETDFIDSLDKSHDGVKFYRINYLMMNKKL
jgi:hypothetical protein